ncbi:MAG: dihydrolipoyl dehydrogenase [Candidatus Omnitrophica bacterium]|nr:dihydrolipoyl dehydrogenase [Candidatus Omnitrophota bacterium]MBU4589368.1 dihydrolipoyl dehydrogenase [Candidatus Omnitrophota bacterium]
MNKYDLAVIGSGPCGYVAAIRAAQLGMKACVLEKDKVGGVCLNRGCIPTKALSASATALYDIRRAGEFGIDVKDHELNFKKVLERKDNIVKKLSSGIEMLMKANKIDVIKAESRIKDKTRIAAGNEEIEAKNILIATGSSPIQLEGMEFDGGQILSSSDMLSLEKVPKSITIVGGGVIGCEFASIFRTFGSEVTIVEMMDQLLPNEDEEIAKKLEQIFKKRGIKVFTKTRAEEIKENSVKTLVSVGRSANSKGIGIENIGIESDKGWIRVDREFRTNVKNIYAAGDVIGGILLAHVASREGICAIEAMSGKEARIDYNAVPNCIFTHPEIASVGLTVNKAKEKGMDARARKFLFSAIGKAHVLGETEGFIKFVVDNKTDKILGAQLIGPHATELIAELSLCVQFGITSEKLASVIHAHPTLSEAIQETSKAVHNRAIHSL